MTADLAICLILLVAAAITWWRSPRSYWPERPGKDDE